MHRFPNADVFPGQDTSSHSRSNPDTLVPTFPLAHGSQEKEGSSAFDGFPSPTVSIV
jgi:hypothetical protein